MASKETCRHELRAAIRQLSERCLYSASKWAAEQLVGIEQDPAKHTPSHTRFQRGSSSIRRRYRTDGSVEATSGFSSTPIAGVSFVATPQVKEVENDVVESDFYLLAKSYFDCKEYRRAAHVLRDQTSKKAAFLRCYALYLVLVFHLSCFWLLIKKCFILLFNFYWFLVLLFVSFFPKRIDLLAYLNIVSRIVLRLRLNWGFDKYRG